MKKLIKFSDNLRLVCEYIPTVRSVSCGVYVGVGSANEDADNNGISHFLEHMSFKGTPTNTSFQIVEKIDNLGAQINAYTSKQMTAYYTICTDEHIESCLTILSDLLLNSLYDQTEMDKEKGVINEEIDMSADSPEDLCIDMLTESFFKDNTLGMPILGSKKNVNEMTSEKLRNYFVNNYSTSNIVISIVGCIKVSNAIELTKKLFVNKFKKSNTSLLIEKVNNPKENYVHEFKSIEQSNIAIGLNCCNYFDDLYYPMILLNNIMGGGMSCRLFQKIREEMGLAYSIYSYPSFYLNNGINIIYLGTNQNSAEKAVKAIAKEIKILKNSGINEDEFRRAKEQAKGIYILGLESTTSLMKTYAKYALYNNSIFDIDSFIEIYNKMTLDDMNKAIEYLNFDSLNISYVGKEINSDLISVFKNEF